MSYYDYPWGGRAAFILRDAKAQAIEKVWGVVKCKESFQLKSLQQGYPPGYPSFEAISVNNVTEIIEHKKMEPLFSITDNPAVWQQYKAIGCS